jgi:iron complex transport system ATP-binding protein
MMGRFARWNFWGQESPEDHAAVHAGLERVGALDLADRHFDELSGGERQRVIIARALAQETRILLLDEPASHLDIAHQLEVFHLVRELATEGYTVLMVCHDLVLAPMFIDHTVLLKGGQILSSGVPQQVLSDATLAHVFGADIALRWAKARSVTVFLSPAEHPGEDAPV